MAHLVLYKDRLKHNYTHLDTLFKKNDISWGVVSKLLCGTRIYLEELLNLGIREVLDSRISNLAVIKEINPEVQTVYIKPPARGALESIIKYADVSFNTEYQTIKMLSEEAVRQNRKHKIIIMIEMGDLREGVMRDELVDFYDRTFKLPNISVIGLGTNLSCMNGVLPSEDKLIQLSLYKKIIELSFDRTIPWVSAGTSVTLPLLLRKMLPKGMNHFRIGETLYFGNNLVTGQPVPGMASDVIKLFAEVIEVNRKPMNPSGVLAENTVGEQFEIDEDNFGKTSYRAILDIGLLDISPEFLIADDPEVKVIGASSDMLVLDLKDNKKGIKVGDEIPFSLKYMGALRLLSSDYIEKRVI